MKNYVDKQIDIDDLNMLRDLFSSDNKNLQIDMIDALGDIYSLTDQILVHEEIIRKNYKFFVKMVTNFIKASVASGVGYFAAISYFDKDPEMFYSFCTCLISTVVGWNLFQRINKEENYVEQDVLLKACDEYEYAMKKLQEYTDFYFDAARKYFKNKKNYVVADEFKKIFANNSDYIKKSIAEGRFEEDFCYETILDVAEDYFNDDRLKEVFNYYDSKQKQRKL